MSEEEHEPHGEIDPGLYRRFKDLFACPLCRHQPLKFFEAYFEPDVPDVLFIMFCRGCGAEVQYSIMEDTLEKTKEELLKARMVALI